MQRPWRGARLHIDIEKAPELAPGEVKLEIDGRSLAGGVLGEVEAGTEPRVRARCG